MKTLVSSILLSTALFSGQILADAERTFTDVAISQSVVVTINQLDVDSLAKLPGIGKVKAQAIIDYKKQHGDFKSITELTKVKGIGQKLLLKIQQSMAEKVTE